MIADQFPRNTSEQEDKFNRVYLELQTAQKRVGELEAEVAKLRDAIVGVVPGAHNSALQDMGQIAGMFMREVETEKEFPATPRNDWFNVGLHYAREIEQRHLPTLKAALAQKGGAK